MCSRARLRSVWMSDRNAPLISPLRLLLRGGGAGARAAIGRLGVGALDVGLRALVGGLGFLLAHVLLVALAVFAALLGDVVLRLRLGFLRLALVGRGRVHLRVELCLGDLLLALGFLL